MSTEQIPALDHDSLDGVTGGAARKTGHLPNGHNEIRKYANPRCRSPLYQGPTDGNGCPR
jgi:hypothetical protein